MKVKLIIISIILLLVMVFASGCIPVLEKIGLVSPTDEEQLSPEKGGPPDGLVKVLIGFKEKPGAAQQAMVQGVGGKIKYTYNIVDAIAASIPQKAIDALRNNPNVRYVEPDGQVFTLEQTLPWGVDRIDAEVVHASDSANKGEGVNVAILDTGIDLNHTDLEVAGGENFSPGKSYDDKNGHGTHVAGIVAALDDGLGVIGVAPGANLYAVKVLGNSGMGWVSDIIAGLDWCVESTENIQVINMSFGGADYVESLELACSSAYDAGLLLVASAGNSGDSLGIGDNVGYPAAYDSVIAVAATEQNDKRASWSSTGPDLELAAPGVSIYSTYIGGGYATMSGTSMASPHVAGVAALVIASGTTVASDVKGKLTDTADDLGATGWDSQFGYGLVDAENAVLGTTDGDDLPSTATGTISGTVTDINTKKPIEGAQMTADGYSDSTKSDGTYTLADVAEGTYTVTASADGYENDSQENVTVSADAITSDVDFTLYPLSATGTMHVHNIEMLLKDATAGPNTFYTAIATVTIVDASAKPVGGVTVSGTWSVATSDSDSGITDASGQVSLQSSKVKNPESGIIFTFTVDGVTKDGWTYNQGANVETSDSITVPQE